MNEVLDLIHEVRDLAHDVWNLAHEVSDLANEVPDLSTEVADLTHDLRNPGRRVGNFALGVGHMEDTLGVMSKLVRRVLSHVEQLATHAASGSRLPELPRSRYRQIESPCRVVYRQDDSHVVVLHVMHSRQRLRTGRPGR